MIRKVLWVSHRLLEVSRKVLWVSHGLLEVSRKVGAPTVDLFTWCHCLWVCTVMNATRTVLIALACAQLGTAKNHIADDGSTARGEHGQVANLPQSDERCLLQHLDDAKYSLHGAGDLRRQRRRPESHLLRDRTRTRPRFPFLCRRMQPSSSSTTKTTTNVCIRNTSLPKNMATSPRCMSPTRRRLLSATSTFCGSGPTWCSSASQPPTRKQHTSRMAPAATLHTPVSVAIVQSAKQCLFAYLRPCCMYNRGAH